MPVHTTTFGPHLFREDAISDETRAFNAEVERKANSMPSIISAPPQVTRDARESGDSI